MKIKKVNVYKISANKKKGLVALVFLLMVCLCLLFIKLPQKINNGLFIYKGDMAYESNAFDDAEICYKKALKYNPHIGKVLFNLGNAYYKQGRFAEAIEAYKNVLLTNDTNLSVQTWNNLGNAYYLTGKLSLSADAYKKALLLKKEDAQIRRNLLFVLIKIDSKNNELASNGKEKKTEKKGASKNENNKNDSNDSKHTKSQENKSENMKLSEANISDLFSLISQNERAASDRISKLKSKSKQLPADGPDY
jgi:Ca-activated chloride channel family protein